MKKSCIQSTIFVCIPLILCTVVGNAHAQGDIRLDITETPFAQGDPCEDLGLPANWNLICGNEVVADLVDFSTGAATGVDVTVADFDLFAADSNNWSAGDTNWVPEGAGVGAGYLEALGNGTVTFENLSCSEYVVEVVGSYRTDQSDNIADITVNGYFADRDANGTGEDGDDYPQGGNGHNNWLIWDSVLPSGGEIVVDLEAPVGTGGVVINAIRLRPKDVAEIRLDVTGTSGATGECFVYGGANWNRVCGNGLVSDLVDYKSGDASSVELTSAGVSYFGYSPDIWSAGDKDWVAEDVGKSAGYKDGSGPVRMTFGCLPGSAYRVEVVGSNRTTDTGTLGDLKVNGVFADGDRDDTGEDGDDYPHSGNGHDNWLIWDEVEPSDGEIVIELTYLAGASGTPINAVRLVGPSIFDDDFESGDTTFWSVVRN